MKKGNEKIVGATSSRPHFEGKTQTGITLIALIITIIVMLILVGVTVNVALNGGLFDTAKQAALGMNMSQIQERAEMVKVALVADIESGKTIVGVKSEYINRLKKEFGVTDNEIVGNKVIVEDGKYDIIVKNTDLDIEVVEHSDRVNTSSIISLILEDTYIEVNDKVYGVNLSVNLNKNIERDEYITKNLEENNKEKAFEEQKIFVLDVFSQEVTNLKGTETTIESTDQYFVEMVNYGATQLNLSTHDNLDDWFTDENLPTIIEALMNLETGTAPTLTNRSDVYNFFMGNTDFTVEVTERDLIEHIYRINQPDENDYGLEYDSCMSNLTLSLFKNGEENPIKVSYSNVVGSIITDNIINKNGEYKFILKNTWGQEIASEIIQVNNIETNNPYVLTEEEADGIWSQYIGDESVISGYYGDEADIILPLYIGSQKMTKILYGSYFSYVESIIIPQGYEELGGYLNQVYHLVEITIPNSVTTIHESTFRQCSNLRNIYFVKGVNDIPNGQPWGAPNATVTEIDPPATEE